MKSALLFTLAVSSLIACTRLVTVSPNSPAAAPNSAPGTPASSTSTLGGNGTYSVGGGNGIDGRAIETYIKEIDQLPEYRQFVDPLLRRMKHGRPDVFVLYLEWAVHGKPWYFVPVELPQLPKEQIHVIFQSDQLALQAKEGIFIYLPTYTSESPKDRATLLVHEMVMAARLLMKESPEMQCDTLNTTDAIIDCDDAANLHSAVSPAPLSPDGPILDGVDHERVRMMTTFLTDDRQNLTAPSLYAERQRLGFIFPWDATISNLNRDDLIRALRRSEAAEDHFGFLGTDGKLGANNCLLSIDTEYDNFSFELGKYSGTFQVGHTIKSVDGTDSYDVPNETIVPNASLIEYSGIDSAFGKIVWGASRVLRADAQTRLPNYSSLSANAGVEVVGVSSPLDATQMVDRVRILPPDYYAGFDPQNTPVEWQFDFFLSRGSAPRILEFQARPVRGLSTTTSGETGPTASHIEWVPVSSLPVQHCRLRPVP